MVNHVAQLASLTAAHAQGLLAAGEAKAEPLLLRLDPERRAKVLMALLGVVLVGVALVALAIVGGRRLRQIAAKPAPPTRRREDEWYRKPLNPDQPNSRQTPEPE